MDLGFSPGDHRSSRPGYNGTSLQAFHKAFPDDDVCMEHVLSKRFSLDPICRRCGGRGRWRRHEVGKYYCHPCGGIVSPMTGSIFDRTRVPLQLWFYALLFFANSAESVPCSFLARQIGVSEPTSFRMSSRIRAHLAAIDEFTKLGGPNQPVMVRVHTSRRVVNARKGSSNRARLIVLGDGNIAHSTVIFKPSRSDLISLVNRRIAAGSELLTDCYSTSRLLSAYGAAKPLAAHRPTFFIDHPEIPDTAHGLMSYIAKSFADQFRGVSLENFWRYLKEYEFRYNRRMQSERIFWDMVSRFPDLSPHDIERVRQANCIIDRFYVRD